MALSATTVPRQLGYPRGGKGSFPWLSLSAMRPSLLWMPQLGALLPGNLAGASYRFPLGVVVAARTGGTGSLDVPPPFRAGDNMVCVWSSLHSSFSLFGATIEQPLRCGRSYKWWWSVRIASLHGKMYAIGWLVGWFSERDQALPLEPFGRYRLPSPEVRRLGFMRRASGPHGTRRC